MLSTLLLKEEAMFLLMGCFGAELEKNDEVYADTAGEDLDNDLNDSSE